MEKTSFAFLLIFTAACTSNRTQSVLTYFVKEKVCSDEALKYLNKERRLVLSEKKYSEREVHLRMMSLEPSIKRCYDQFISNTNNSTSFNLCFVVGYDPAGNREFFEFSSKEIELNREFKSCLNNLKNSDSLNGLKDFIIMQPYRLFPTL